MSILDRSVARHRAARSVTSWFTSDPGQTFGHHAPTTVCDCGEPIVHARTTSGEEVVLDAQVDGTPSRFARSGCFIEVATTPDVLGRRALLVQPSTAQGDLRRHRCLTHS